MSEHDLVLDDLAPSDAQADLVKGGLRLDLSPLIIINVTIPGLGI